MQKQTTLTIFLKIKQLQLFTSASQTAQKRLTLKVSCYRYLPQRKDKLLFTWMLRQTAVTDYLKSEQLLLITFDPHCKDKHQ